MKKSVVCMLLFFFGCSDKSKPSAVHIGLINNNRSIKFTGFDRAIISEINRDSVPGIWQGLIPVYRMPADTDMKDYQRALPGIYTLKDSAVLFTPDTPFVKNQTYYVRYFKFDGGYSAWDFIKGKRRLGKILYTDLIFKQ
ncbi:MAG TPA: hypothetical protein VIJ27_08075 [Mucilaginibacter sp.]